MNIPARLPYVVVAAALVAGCGDRLAPPRPDTPAAARPAATRVEAPRDPGAWRVTLVDSVAFVNEMASGVAWRVRVGTADAADTLPGVLVLEEPVVVGDSAVVGIRCQEDRAVGLFAYDRRTHRTLLVTPPAGWIDWAVPALAPDGRHVAFLGRDAQGRGYGAVATVPAMRVVFRGPPVTMFETDAGVEHISWSDARHFEIRIELTHTIGGEHRIRGSLEPLGAVIDTVPALRP